MNNEESIEAFNTLIIINNDRIEGYTTAKGETKETDLKLLFSDLIATSVQNRNELIDEVKKLGGKPEEGTRITGKFFRVWMDVKAAFTKSDRKSILDSCEYGENVILETYNKILLQDHHATNSKELDLLNKHYALLKADHDKIKKCQEEI
jgi:uncharacterized protein (TIGR02284 family)